MNGTVKNPHQDFAEFLRQDLALDTVRTIDSRPRDMTPGARAAFSQPRNQMIPEEIATLLWDGTCYRWDYGRDIAPPTSFSTPARRAWWWNKPALAPPPKGEVVQQLVFEQLEKAQIGEALTALDRRLTPAAFNGSPDAPGIRRWTNGNFTAFDPTKAGKSKRILLFIHGTFSNSESLLSGGLMQIPAGVALLSKAETMYDLILSFDHPTLSLSPPLNAVDLARVIRRLAPTHLDIVCHSRGGLIARWYCEVLAPAALQVRVVLVASPIAGTSLAAAPRIRAFFDYLTNAANTLRTVASLASVAAPWLAAVTGLMRIATAITGGLARLPIADGLIALVPGLQGQARIGNNEEICRLQRGVSDWNTARAKLRYFAITADFQPKDPGWNFLAYFRNFGTYAANAVADGLFPYANDLVVDTNAMTDLNGKIDAEAVRIADCKEFDTSSGVHHCNYFVQSDTAAAISTWLTIP